jgi:hypothetical protein
LQQVTEIIAGVLPAETGGEADLNPIDACPKKTYQDSAAEGQIQGQGLWESAGKFMALFKFSPF